VGGSVPKNFFPAVEKGVRQALDAGVIAGFALQDVRVTVIDGKSHAVDSKEVAFIAAGRKATIAAVRSAQPVVLEPVVEVEIISPLDCVGDLTGDLAGKRAQVTATEAKGDDRMLVRARVPLAELDDYQSRLKSITGGQGSYRLQFSHYAQVPMSVQQQLVARHAPAHRDED
ncbi:MAG TPA: elongation factor G, partial [Burkholderiaceae bacterium]|nr:elongation factor G [Burkholderiaceae bacterium]